MRKVAIRGERRFLIDGRPHRKRLFLREKDCALAQADVWARERENQGIEALEFPTALRLEATASAKVLKPFGKTLLDAARHYAQYLEAEQRKSAALSVRACLDEWIKSKKAEAARALVSNRTIQELEGRAKLIGAAFNSARISEIDEDAILAFLDSLNVTQRTRLNVRTKLVQFLNYCRRRKWVDTNRAEMVSVRVPRKEVVILSPSQAERILRTAERSECASALVPYISLGLFAGLRPGEAEQLKWELIRFDTGEIEVRGETSKRRETRFVELEIALQEWLAPYRKEKGSLVGKNLRRQWENVRIKAGYALRDNEGAPWPHDVLRHCYGSYWLAEHGNRGRLAELMGNSVQVIRQHYRRAIPRAEAHAFWALRPTLAVP